MLLWNEEFATGLETIDKQHKMLIDHINRLEEMLAHSNPTPAEIEFARSLVQFLEFYADTHFKFEETCMARYHCSAHAQNQEAHAEFMAFFVQFKEQFKSEGFQVAAFAKLHQTISGWIIGHILKIDTQLKACVKH